MRSEFALAGHPLHPLLVALPIGLFVGTLVADLVDATDQAGRPEWYDIAFWSGSAAVVTALLAVLTASACADTATASRFVPPRAGHPPRQAVKA